MKRLFKYFMNGFLIMAPITITCYLIISIFGWFDSMFDLGEIPGIGHVHGLGIILIVIMLTSVGYIGSSFLVQPFLLLMERILAKVPLVSIIYSAIKDLFDAFVGDNQKFNYPVMAKMYDTPETYRMGFITQESMVNIGREDLVAVYFPDSYNISGELWFCKKDNIKFIDLPSSEVMKFIVSGGVSKI